VLELLASSTERIILTEEAFQRAENLETLGYDAFDALHLACAEQAQVDELLTTDDRFIRRVQRGLGNSRSLSGIAFSPKPIQRFAGLVFDPGTRGQSSCWWLTASLLCGFG
jgi:hypothetical protein